MHICFLTHEYPQANGDTGGTGTFVQTLGRLLVRAGHRASVVGTWRNLWDSTEDDEGVTVHRVRGSRLPTARFLPNSMRIDRRLAEIHRQTPIDVIEASNMGFAFVGHRIDAARVIRMHGGHLYHRYELNEKPALWRSFQERRSFRRADHYVAVGEYVGKITARLLQIDWEQVKVIYNFVDDQLFCPSAETPTPDPHTLLTVGTVCKNKGMRELVLAVLQLIEEFPSVVLTIAGRDWRARKTDPSYRKTELLPLIPAAAREHFRFIGPVAHGQVPQLLAKNAICVYPSHTEAMPVAWLETLAMGKPLIGGDIEPGREVIRDGVDGLLCNPHDPADIAAKIRSVLRSESLRQELAANARQRFADTFSTEKLLGDNLSFFEQCIQGSPEKQASCC